MLKFEVMPLGQEYHNGGIMSSVRHIRVHDVSMSYYLHSHAHVVKVVSPRG